VLDPTLTGPLSLIAEFTLLKVSSIYTLKKEKEDNRQKCLMFMWVGPWC
jgi:hypothetical protein